MKNVRIIPAIPKADYGILNISNCDFNKNGNIPLDGNWEFYWDRLFMHV